jgi:O-antigen/teichoic acid export membrane protein
MAPSTASHLARVRQITNLAGLLTSRTGVLVLTTLGTLFVRTGSSMLLTRLLIPDDFGIVGIIGSVFYTVALITDIGTTAFLIRHERTGERHFRDVIWTIHAKRGFALFVAVATLSPLIARALGKPTIALPLAVASLTFTINAFSSMSLVTALRNDKSRELSLFEFGLQIAQTTACILFALWWRNVWALIGAMVLQSLLRTALSYRIFPDAGHRPTRDPAIFRELVAFSRLILVSSCLTLLIAQSDKLVLARLFTLHEFGLYAIALSITSAPIAFADSYVLRIVFPLYAQHWREAPAELPRIYYKVRHLPSALFGFGAGGLIGGAPFLVALLYDPRYAPAATFISLLMISVALRLPNAAALQLLTATGDIKRLVQTNVVRVAWLAIAIPVGFLFLGAIGVVAAVGLIEVPAMLFTWVLLGRIKILDLRQELLFLAIVVAGAAIGAAISAEALHLFPHV